MTFHVAAGNSWQDCRVTQGHIIYVAAEGGRRFSKRTHAISKELPELFAKAQKQFCYLPLQLDLHATEDADALLTAIGDRPVDMLIIDTLAMSFGAGNENDGKDVTQFLTNIAHIREKLGCHVMLVHHSGKDQARGARGHSSLRAAIDTEIELTVDGLMRAAKATKQRDLEGGKVAAFTLETVQLAEDLDGDPITSCIVKPQDAAELKRRKSRMLTGLNEVAYQALHDALRDKGTKVSNSEHYPLGRKVVNSEVWYEQFKLRRAEDGLKEDSVRKAFNRARSWLQEHDYTREYDDKIWFIDETDRQDN